MSVQSANHINPGLIFLGLCDRASYVRDGNTNLFNWNILGLRDIVLSYIYPISLDGWFIGFAFHSSKQELNDQIRFIDEFGKQVGTINLSRKVGSPGDDDAPLKTDGPLIRVIELGWTIVFLPLIKLGWLIPKPGTYYLEHITDDGVKKMGILQFIAIDPPQLTQERITSIKSEPNSMKAIRMDLHCRRCSSNFLVYASIDRDNKAEKQGWRWYKDVPQEFTCQMRQDKYRFTIY